MLLRRTKLSSPWRHRNGYDATGAMGFIVRFRLAPCVGDPRITAKGTLGAKRMANAMRFARRKALCIDMRVRYFTE